MKKKNNTKQLDRCLIDLNEYWTYAVESDELFNDESAMFWFDKTDYRFYSFAEIMQNSNQNSKGINDKKYVKLFQVNSDMQWKSMLEIINNPRVIDYFNKAKNIDDIIVRYRSFVDYNCLAEAERYRLYLKVIPLFIDWCKSNDIQYYWESNSPESAPPPNYAYYSKEIIEKTYWEIPGE